MKSIRPLLQTIKIEYCKISIIYIFFAILSCSCKNEIHNQINNSIPVLGNLFGTVERVAIAMGKQNIRELRELGQFLADLKEHHYR